MHTPDLPPLSVPPTLETPRLLLRQFRADDAASLVRELSDVEVARETLNIPHPYAPERAQEFLDGVPQRLAAGKAVVWAITERPSGTGRTPPDDGPLVGAVGLNLTRAHRRAELGYWIAKSRWGRGYATEASQAALTYGFEALGLHRIEAHHFVENPASGAVMRKLGMQREGRLRGTVWRDGVPRDLELYAILAGDPRR